MKKYLLRVLMILFGLNVFTSCYGMPPGDWIEPNQLPEEQNQTRTSVQPDEDTIEEPSLEQSEETDSHPRA